MKTIINNYFANKKSLQINQKMKYHAFVAALLLSSALANVDNVQWHLADDTGLESENLVSDIPDSKEKFMQEWMVDRRMRVTEDAED